MDSYFAWKPIGFDDRVYNKLVLPVEPVVGVSRIRERIVAAKIVAGLGVLLEHRKKKRASKKMKFQQHLSSITQHLRNCSANPDACNPHLGKAIKRKYIMATFLFRSDETFDQSLLKSVH